MSADRIAEVVADIRAGRVVPTPGLMAAIREPLLASAQIEQQPVVDCTAIFNMQLKARAVHVYEDNPCITPPWTDALFGFVNSFGNTIVMAVHRDDWDGSPIDSGSWDTTNEIDWPRVRWIVTTSVWVGGQSGDGRFIPTTGPCHLIRHAIRDDGAPEDINWMELTHNPTRPLSRDEPESVWEATMITLTASLNFLNCSNVDIAEPARPRAERRRIGRTGVRVQEIVVRPAGRRRSDDGYARPIDASETPLTSVRGHFVKYGIEGRGKLFGKHTGRFWVPAHVRGVGDGEAPARGYTLKP